MPRLRRPISIPVAFCQVLALAGCLAMARGVGAHEPTGHRIDELSRLVRAHPDNLSLYLERAELRRISGDHAGAARDLDVVARRDAVYRGLDLCRAALAMDRGDAAVALQVLDAALAQRPDDVEAHRLRAGARAAAGDRRGAVTDLDAALAGLERPSPDLYLQRARLLVELGAADEALHGLDEARFKIGISPALEIYAIEMELAAEYIADAQQRLDELSAVYPDPAPLAGLAARIAAATPEGAPWTAAQPIPGEGIPDSPEQAASVRDLGVRGVPYPVALVGDQYPISRGATWKYLATATAADPSWNQPGYDDNLWSAGPAPLGFGDPEIVTTVPYGPNPNQKYPTTYFRHSFNVPDPPAQQISLVMTTSYDDGFVAYVNGVEVARRGFPAGPVGYATLAANHEGGTYETIELTSSLGTLVQGTNVFAVEVHQTSATSSDLQWDTDLFYTDTNSVTRGPYLQMCTPTGINVRWRTTVLCDTRVRYGTMPENLSGDAYIANSTREHEVQLSGLLPATRYYYSVGTLGGALAGDATYTFVTAPLPGVAAPTRIWVIGDSGQPGSGANAVRDAYATWTGARGTDLWLMLGDNAYPLGTDSEYQAAIFDQYPVMLKQAPLWPTRGNHDAIHSGTNNDYYEAFTMPTLGNAGGLASGTEAYYSFDWADIHFICLDSEGTDRSPTGAMMTWLANDLAASHRQWVIAYWHHPPYTKGSHDSDNETDSAARMGEMRRNALPILEAAGVDLVLAGHSHSYERSFLIDSHYGLSSHLQSWMIVDGDDGRPNGDGAYIKPIGEPTPHAGEVFAVAGSSSLTSGGPLNHPVMVTSFNVLGSMVLDVDGNRLDARFLSHTGAVLDSFAIIKNAIIPVAVNDDVETPRTLTIGPGMPNPFTAQTHIAYTLEHAGPVRLSLLDATGRRVASLVNERQKAGAHDARWDGRDGAGRPLPNGVYLAVLESGGKRVSRKIAYVR